MNKNMFGKILMLITCFIWATNFTFSKIALLGMNEYTYNSLRFLIGAVILTVIFRKHLIGLDKKIIGHGIFLGAFLFAASIFVSLSLNLLSASESSIYVGVEIPMIPFIAMFVLKDKLSVQKVISAMLAFYGIFVMNFDGGSFTFNEGLIYALLAALCYSFHIIFTSKYVAKEDAVALVTIQGYAVAAYAFIANFIATGSLVTMYNTDMSVIVNLLMAAILINGVSYVLQTNAQKHISASDTGIITSLIPVFGVVIAVITLKENLDPKTYMGMAYIIGAIIIANLHFEAHRKHIKGY